MSEESNTFIYETRVRIKRDGLWYNVICREYYVVNWRSQGRKGPDEAILRLIESVYKIIYRYKINKKLDFNPISDLQISEKKRLKLIEQNKTQH
jgi:hypothetical protein